MIRLTLEGIGVDPARQPVMILKDEEGSRILPVWIGPTEARSIELELREIRPDRPLSHDLLLGMIKMAHATVQQVVINDLQDSTFYATIDLDTQKGPQHVDSRPSDAIALAVRAKCPIFVDGKAVEALTDATEMGQESEKDKKQSKEEEEEIKRFKRLLGEDDDE